MSVSTLDDEAFAAPDPNVWDLSQRFVVQLDQGNFGGEIGHWQSLVSAPTLPEALRMCSDCLNLMQGAIGVSMTLEMPGLSRSFRIWDAAEEKAVVWEDGEGRLWTDDVLLQAEIAELGFARVRAFAPRAKSELDPGAPSPDG